MCAESERGTIALLFHRTVRMEAESRVRDRSDIADPSLISEGSATPDKGYR